MLLYMYVSSLLSLWVKSLFNLLYYGTKGKEEYKNQPWLLVSYKTKACWFLLACEPPLSSTK